LHTDLVGASLQKLRKNGNFFFVSITTVAVNRATRRGPRIRGRVPQDPVVTGTNQRFPAEQAQRSDGYGYVESFVTSQRRQQLDQWLATLHPLWEQRYSTHRPPPQGKQQHALLRPVYWLGNWQFACLGYYEPPRRTRDVAVAAEPFSDVIKVLVHHIETLIRKTFPAQYIPTGWHLNTCLVNFYGNRWDGKQWIDRARVGEHRDFEPGPVASISLGERALFQFCQRGTQAAAAVKTQWLDDNSLQFFGGPRWKEHLLHRVTRVENKHGTTLGPAIEHFATRRINLTFRFVPTPDITEIRNLSARARSDIAQYLEQLALHSEFYATQVRSNR
jgi:DNA oxidative demethylase